MRYTWNIEPGKHGAQLHVLLKLEIMSLKDADSIPLSVCLIFSHNIRTQITSAEIYTALRSDHVISTFCASGKQQVTKITWKSSRYVI